MKKIISILLALIMVFSVTTVAFAEDAADTDVEATAPVEGETSDENEEDSLLGEYDWILDMPFWTVKPAFKVAKIALKLAKVYLKLGLIFGWVDKEELTQQIGDLIGGLIGNIQPEESAPETEEVTTTLPEAEAA